MHHEHTSLKNSTLKVRYNSESSNINIHLCTAYDLAILRCRNFAACLQYLLSGNCIYLI